MKRLYIFLFCICIVSGFSQELSFENLQLKGLPSTEIYQVFQDSKGFFWFATDAGVCRYDGNTLKTFTVKDGLCENVVLKIKEDSKKRIWFSSLSGLFFYYENDHFTAINSNQTIQKIHRSHPVVSFGFGENDTLIIPGSISEGVLKIAPQQNYGKAIHQSGQFMNSTRFLLKNKMNLIDGPGRCKPSNSVYSLFLLDTVLQISTKDKKYHNSITDFISQIGPDGTVYLINRNQLVQIKNRKQIRYSYFPTDIIEVRLDKDNHLWIGTIKNGLFLYKNADLNKKPIRSLPPYSVSSIMQDKEGTVWVSTLEKGIFQCMNKYVYTIKEKVNDLKVSQQNLSVVCASHTELMITSRDSIRSLPNLFLPYQQDELVSIIKHKYAPYYVLKNHLFEVHNNVSSEITSHYKNRGPTYYTDNTNINYNESDTTEHSMPFQAIHTLSNDTLLGIGSGTRSIYKIFHSRIFSCFISSFIIKFSTILPDKRVLIASRTNSGIFEFKNNTLFPFLGHLKELKTRINWVTVDSSGNYWIATNEKGLYCYDTQKKLHVFNESNGLVSNKVNCCIASPTGEIWFSSFLGLSKLTFSSGLENVRIENFDKNHGIVDLEIQKIAWFDNAIWCAGKTAFFYFPTAKMKKNMFPPGVYLKSVSAAGKNYPFNDTLFLNYDQNDFHAQYELISSKKVTQPTFFYKLEGYDKNWRISHTGDIQYTNIGHGSYTLLVYGINNDGIKNSTPQKITFIIKRPFWLTWWFILLEIVIAAILTYYFLNIWRKRIEKKEHEKAAINQEIAEFKMTALRSQMNPHFIFNAIGSIQHHILKNDVLQSSNYLSKFASLIRNILNNSNEEYIALSREITTLQLYIELEQIRFNPPFEFILKVDEKIDREVYIPTMLIQPYVENSLWHGLMPKDSKGKLELIFEKREESIKVIIRDNGMGRRPKTTKTHDSKGMSVTEQRIKVLENTSTKKFEVNIVDIKDSLGNPAGTEVNLIIPFDE